MNGKLGINGKIGLNGILKQLTDIDLLRGIVNSDLVLHSSDSGLFYSYSIISGHINLYASPNGGANVIKGLKVKIKPNVIINPNVLRYMTIVASGTKAQYTPFEVYLMDSANVLTRVLQYGFSTTTLPVNINSKIDLNTIGTLENKAYTVVIYYGPWGNEIYGSASSKNIANINVTTLKFTML